MSALTAGSATAGDDLPPYLPVTRRQHAVDYLGASLIVGGVSALRLVASLGGTQLAWGSPTILGLSVTAVALLGFAVLQERRHPDRSCRSGCSVTGSS